MAKAKRERDPRKGSIRWAWSATKDLAESIRGIPIWIVAGAGGAVIGESAFPHGALTIVGHSVALADTTPATVTRYVIGAIVGGVMALVLMLAWCVIRAPYEQRNELLATVHELEATAAAIPQPRDDAEAREHRGRIASFVRRLDSDYADQPRLIKQIDAYAHLQDHLGTSEWWVQQMPQALAAWEEVESADKALLRSIGDQVVMLRPTAATENLRAYGHRILQSFREGTPLPSAWSDLHPIVSDEKNVAQWQATMEKREKAEQMWQVILGDRPLDAVLKQRLRATQCDGCRE